MIDFFNQTESAGSPLKIPRYIVEADSNCGFKQVVNDTSEDLEQWSDSSNDHR